jgi:WD40 repeat protein
MHHENEVYTARFSPNGKHVLTASKDWTARLWDAETGKSIGEPMGHEDWVVTAKFSPDGKQVLTASEDGRARLWDVPAITSPATTEDVLLLADFAEATAGVALQKSGQTEILNALSLEQVNEMRRKIAARFLESASELTPLQRCLQWSVSDPRKRSLSPFSKRTVSSWVEERINEGTLDGLRAAIRVDPANMNLAAHFGRRLADHALEKGTAPAEARRDRAEADFQTRRALSRVPENDEVKKLRGEVIRLLQLTSQPL